MKAEKDERMPHVWLKFAPTHQVLAPISVIGLIFFVYIDPAIAELGICCPIAELPPPRARRVPPPIARQCVRLGGAGRRGSQE